MAAAMVLGSYFAGSTPMGGGVVGFPTLVLLLDQPAAIGRDFSLAIQAVGMTSATILIFVLRRPLAWRFMGWESKGMWLPVQDLRSPATPTAANLYVYLPPGGQ